MAWGGFEQPTIRYNLKSLSDVKHRTAVPILGHEVNWTMYELINVLRENCVDCVKLDGRFDAGYTGVRISAGMAEAAGIPCVHQSFFQLGISLAGVYTLWRLAQTLRWHLRGGSMAR